MDLGDVLCWYEIKEKLMWIVRGEEIKGRSIYDEEGGYWNIGLSYIIDSMREIKEYLYEYLKGGKVLRNYDEWTMRKLDKNKYWYRKSKYLEENGGLVDK